MPMPQSPSVDVVPYSLLPDTIKSFGLLNVIFNIKRRMRGPLPVSWCRMQDSKTSPVCVEGETMPVPQLPFAVVP